MDAVLKALKIGTLSSQASAKISLDATTNSRPGPLGAVGSEAGAVSSAGGRWTEGGGYRGKGGGGGGGGG